MSDQLTFTFPYIAAEHAEVLAQSRAGRRERLLLKSFGILIGASGAVAGVAGILGGEAPSAILIAIFPFMVLAAVWAWLAPAGLRRFRSEYLRRQGIKDGRTTEVMTFEAEGLRPGRGWSNVVPWDRVGSVIETTGFVVVDVDGDLCYVPKSAITANELLRLRTLVERALGEHYTRQLRSSPSGTHAERRT